MSNYPNMSYCMFENTSNAMDQIASALEDAIENNKLLELNQYEERPFTSMHDKCVSLMRLLEDYDQMQAEINDAECREEEDDAIDET
jgi:hypothetical protein